MEHTVESALRTVRRFRALAGTVVVVLVIGVTFYHFVEDLRWVDSLYFCVMTLTTVGYGDLTPQTDAGKMFTVGYVLVGIGILGAFANNLLRTGLSMRWLKQQNPEEIQKHLNRQTK